MIGIWNKNGMAIKTIVRSYAYHGVPIDTPFDALLVDSSVTDSSHLNMYNGAYRFGVRQDSSGRLITEWQLPGITCGPTSEISITNIMNINIPIGHSNVFYSHLIQPSDDNTYSIGKSNARYTSIYATNGTIQTSDRTKKREIKEIDPIYEQLFMETVTVQYLFNDGDRIHFGVVSQDFEEKMHELVS